MSSDAAHSEQDPARARLSGHHPAVLGMLRHFEYRHLAHPELRAVSALFGDVAHELVSRVPSSPELTVALRKLLEGKDAAVRAAVDELRNAGEAPGKNANDLS